MGCIGCSCSTGKDATAGGCQSKGGCATGGCNRHNTYDWITALGINDVKQFDIIEVTFKNGARKEFFKNPPFTRATTGDWVVVESYSGGFDVGKVSLSGELVRLQMKKKRVRTDARIQTVVRKAHERDLERLDEVRRMEKEVMVKARVIARTLDLDMKVGDVEFQGDGRKCTFYYTADGRVDFRELIRSYAREFKVKIEMRQIGARQESARIGGLGNCGRELCCSTWLSEFKSVNTAAARYQNLAINQTKLSGMCGRLKCCLNYELDTYIDALEDFPDRAEKIKTLAGLAILVKTDVFKRLMFYTYVENRSKFYAIHVDQIWEALDLIKNGKTPASLEDILAMAPTIEGDEPEEAEPDYDSINDVIQLPLETRKKKKKKKKTRDRSQSVAAAVEKEPLVTASGNNQRKPQPQNRSSRPPQARPNQPVAPGGQKSEGGPQQGPRPPQQQKQGPKPEQRQGPRPEQKQGPRPEQKQGPRPEQKPEQRPPQGPRPEQKQEPRTPDAKVPPGTQSGDKSGGPHKDRGRNWDKRNKFKGNNKDNKDKT